MRAACERDPVQSRLGGTAVGFGSLATLAVNHGDTTTSACRLVASQVFNLAAVVVAAELGPAQAAAHQRADLEGVVRSRVTGRGVRGAQVWAAGTPWGAVTDSAGRFRLSALSPLGFTLVVRLCDRTVADSLRMLFNPARPIHPELIVDGVPSYCPPLGRPPWAVDRSDPIIEGYHIQGSDGSLYLSCANELFFAWYPESGRAQLAAYRPAEGARLFVRLRGRRDDDPARPRSDALFIGEVLEIRAPRPADCRPRLLQTLEATEAARPAGAQPP